MPLEIMYAFQGAFAMGAVVLTVQYVMSLRRQPIQVKVSPPDRW